MARLRRWLLSGRKTTDGVGPKTPSMLLATIIACTLGLRFCLMLQADVWSTCCFATCRTRTYQAPASLVGSLGRDSSQSADRSLTYPRRVAVAPVLWTTLQFMEPVSAAAIVPAPISSSAEGDIQISRSDSVVLNNGILFPKASFGLQAYGIAGDDKARALTAIAVERGYRNFFASVEARNQRGFAMGIKDSAIPRDQVFICGSVNSKRAQGFQRAYEETKQGCEDNLRAFAVGGIDYVDMMVLDYPGPDCESIRGQWKAFQEMADTGKTKSIAVSNFGLTQLDCILSDPSLVVPAVNQLRFNADAYQPSIASAIVEENRKRGITVQAWSPLRVGEKKKRKAAEFGKKYGKSGAQVLLRWVLQMGATFTTQSSRAERLAENVQVFDFELSSDDMDALSV